MELRQGYTLLTLKEIQTFLDANAAKLTGLAETGARKKLDQLVAELTRLAAVQTGSSAAAKSATQKQRMLTKALLAEMEPIARIAVADLPPTPELAPLRMPKARETGERLVALARGMASEAAKFKPTFVEAGLPDDFAEQLLAAADALAACLTERKQRHGDRGAATRVLPRGLSGARKAVHVLDVFVKKAAKDDGTLLAAWKIVKRTQRRREVKVATPAAAPESTPTGGVA